MSYAVPNLFLNLNKIKYINYLKENVKNDTFIQLSSVNE